MNILQLTDYLPDYPGNFGETIIGVCEKAKEIDRIVFVVFPEKRKWHEKVEQAGGILIYMSVYKFKDKKIDWVGFRKLNKVVKVKNISVVHVHFGLTQKIITLFLKLSTPKLKLFWHWRGDVKKLNSGILFFYKYFSNAFVHKHITNSSNITERLKKQKLVKNNKIYTLPNAVNINHKTNSDLDSETQKQIGKRTPIIMIRNFRKPVDFNIILDTMEFLINENLVLLWIGYGETEKEIKNEVEKRGIDNILFLGKQADVSPYYDIAKINIIAWEPWCNETINNTAYEALLHSKPVVGLNFGALPAAFNRDEGVYTVPLSAKEYGNQILYILKNYNAVLKNVEIGKEKILKHYSLDNYIDKLFALYGI